jgi:LysR family glycine cleavage system transcriptional activator
MRRFLPSLSALRVFDAAGRLLSFSKAAVELNVTQSAVSRQIRNLEEGLGGELFVRLTRKVELTEFGVAYLRSIRAAFDDIERATQHFRSQGPNRILRVGVLPSVAHFWLMPRLAGFSQQHPDIEIRLISSVEPVDFTAGDVDVAIRVGPLPGRHYGARQPRIDLQMVRNWRDVRADMLFPDVLVPVCSRRFQQQESIDTYTDLERAALIHTNSRRHAWPDWFEAHGLAARPYDATTNYGHFFMAMEAACDDMGVAIVPHVLVENGSSRLVRLWPADKPSAGEYYLLSSERDYERREIALFREWLINQAGSASVSLAAPHGVGPAATHEPGASIRGH